MFSMDGFLYRLCTWIYYFALLNVMFLVSCILVVTIPAASAALFGVIRKLIRGDEPSLFREYRKQFVENFKQSLIIGVIMLVIGLFWAEDVRLTFLIHTPMGLYVRSALLLVGLLYFGTLLHVFPLMVHGYFTVKHLLVSAFKLSLYRYHLTLANVIAVVVLFVLSLRFSFLFVFFYFSLATYVTYWLVNRKFMVIWPEPAQDGSPEQEEAATS